MTLSLLTWVSTIKAILVNDSLKKTNGSLYSLFFDVAKKKKKAMAKATCRRKGLFRLTVTKGQGP